MSESGDAASALGISKHDSRVTVVDPTEGTLVSHFGVSDVLFGKSSQAITYMHLYSTFYCD